MQSETKPTSRDPLPESFDSIEDFSAFWDTHSTADYEDLMKPVEMEIELRSSKSYCAIEKEMLRKVRAQARRQGVSTETLINLWLQEKLAPAT